MPPVAFDRNLFCLRDDAQLEPVSCPDPPHLDALSHHPYGIGGPLWHALNPDDAAVPDMYKIARVLHAAERAGHVLPAGPKQLWVTEISWDSSPPDPNGVPILEQAHWLEQSLYVLWRPGRGYRPVAADRRFAADPQLRQHVSGWPVLPRRWRQAGGPGFRFPFVTRRLNAREIEAWGRSPADGKVAIEQLRGARWVLLRRLSVRVDQVFTTTVPVRGAAVLRAQVVGQTSLPWTQGG